MAFRDDVRYSLRGLMRSPWVTGGVVFAAGIGIGANSVVFGFIGSVVDPSVAAGSHSAETIGSRLSAIRLLLLAGATGVFAIAAATVGGLLLSRGAARVHETSVRIALGAHRGDLVRLLLAEGLVMGLAATIFGMLVAFWTINAVPALFYEGDMEKVPLVMHWPATIASGAVGFVAVTAAALSPLLWSSRRRPSPDSRGTGPGLANTFGRWRSGLVLFELTLCAVFLVSSEAMVARLDAALISDHAARAGNAAVARVEPEGRFFQPTVMAQYVREARRRLEGMPLGVVHSLPGASRPAQDYRIDRAVEWTTRTLETASFDTTLLRARSVRTTAGRLFGGGDGFGTCRVVVINDAAAALVGGDALGRLLISSDGGPAIVIGVLRDPSSLSRSTPRLWFYGPQEARDSRYREAESWRLPVDAAPREVVRLATDTVAADVLAPMGITVVAGRYFEARDDRTRCGVAVVNEEAAALLGGTAAVGTAIVDSDGGRREIIGVVRQEPFRTLQPRAQPTVFLPFAQNIPSSIHLLLPPGSTAAFTRLADLPGARLALVATMQEHLQRTSLPADRILTTIVRVLALLALVLAMTGVWGLTTDAVARKTPEIALRMALGAPGWRIVTGVVAYGFRLACAAVVAGMILSAVGARLVSPVPGAPASPGPMTWLMAGGVLLVIVTVGSLVPARRALDVDPAMLLRE